MTTNIDKLAKLMETHNMYSETLARLQRNADLMSDGKSPVKAVKFELNFGAHVHWHQIEDDGKLNDLLRDTAIEHIKEQLEVTTHGIRAAEQALSDAFKLLLEQNK